MCKEIEGFPLTKIRKGVYTMFYLGIDIAKVNHVASLIGEDGSVLVKAIKFTNSNEGLQKLIDSISEYDQSQIYCAMEATGTYWLSLFSALTDKDFNVSVFNPYQIKSFRGAYSNRKQKNDVIDSIIIAEFLRFNGIEQTCLPNDDLLALKNLTRYRSNLVNNISKAKIQIKGILNKVFPEYSDVFSDTFGDASKQILLNCPTPSEVANFNTRKLANLLKKASRGRHGTDTVRKVKELAKNSFGIKFTGDACSFEIKQLVSQIIFLENQVDELNLKIDYAVLLKVDYDLALKRTLGRQICPNCKKSYNRLTGVNAPKVEDMCDDCNVPLTTRNDDNEETFKIGFAAYEKNCAPVIEYYRNKGMLIELDASKDPEYTFEQLEKIIGSKND